MNRHEEEVLLRMRIERAHELFLTLAGSAAVMACVTGVFFSISGVGGGFVVGLLFTCMNSVTCLLAWRRRRRAVASLRALYDLHRKD
jgi:hypothetical protein